MMRLVMPRRMAVLLAAVALAAGCGKTASDPSGDDGGATALGTGGVTSGGFGVGGSATGAAGDGGNLADCPLATPTDGDPCAVAGPCEYNFVDKGCCFEVTTARCIDAVWEVSERDCDCPVEGTGGSAASADACTTSDDCLITLKDCCAPCDMNVAGDYVALNRAAVAEYDAAKCATDATCPPCVSLGTQSVVATCNAGRCEVVDLANDPITSCSTADDCLIVTRECCECGADVQSLAVINRNARTDFAAVVCGPDTGCDGCLPTLPDWQAPVCTGGTCEIDYY
jgi:hypothetical protein